MTPPADLSALRALVEAVRDGHTHACYIWIGQDCSCAHRLVSAAREALERVEMVVSSAQHADAALADAFVVQDALRASIARLEEALRRVEYLVEGCDDNLAIALRWLVHTALEGRDA